MKKLVAKVRSLHLGSSDKSREGELGKDDCSTLEAELDGFIGDRHRAFYRECWKGDKQPEGKQRRNERQWSAVSAEELSGIAKEMGLKETLRAGDLGANICLEGVPQLSRLPRGSILKFPSGAELMVEEYNPPCKEMGQKIAASYTTVSGKPLLQTTFSKSAQLTRGLVGVVEVEGSIRVGDAVTIEIYEHPKWLALEDVT
jgi:MOSC domain-containing protein YiiM